MKPGHLEPTQVIFRTFPKDGEVIALFPGMAATCNPWHCLCYAHTGQHSSADPHIVYDTRPSTPEESQPLHLELEQIGYTLKPVKKFTRRHYAARVSELDPLKP